MGGDPCPDLMHPAQVALAGSKLVDVCEVTRGSNFPSPARTFLCRWCLGTPSTPVITWASSRQRGRPWWRPESEGVPFALFSR